MVNLSDVAAMGGVPRYFLISLAIPKNLPFSFVSQFYRGIWDGARRFGVILVGGDTSLSRQIVVISDEPYARISYDGKEVPNMVPSVSLSLFLFGIFALIMVLLWEPINSALQDSNWGVGGAFVGILVVGILAMFIGSRMTSRSARAA